jgi:pimeloyl-ACP methyl ester carboxylesterase
MPAHQTKTLPVAGATLHYEIWGSGPLIVIIPGGPQDAGVFAGLADQLSDRYTVLSFDPRGNSRTMTDTQPGDLDVDVIADDVAALIAANGGGPAFIFGTSGGAQIGLNLAARHPTKVSVLIAHEPPSIMLLADPEPALAGDRALHETYRRDGVEAAMGQFLAENGLDGPPDCDMPPEVAETFGRIGGNFEYWLAHGMLPLSTYRPDVEALRNGAPRIVVAIGTGSVGQPIEAMSQAVADQLGIKSTAFPGDHMGFESDVDGFAAAMTDAFLEDRHD